MTFWDRHHHYLKKYGMVTALLFELVAWVLIGFFFGRYLDEKLGTDPAVLISGVILGFIFGIYRFYSQLRRFFK